MIHGLIRSPRRASKTSFLTIAALVFVNIASLRAASAVFNFDNDLSGKETPFTDTNNGVSAMFKGSGDPGGFVVRPTFYSALTGNVLYAPADVFTPAQTLTIVFNPALSGISMTFATNSLASGAVFELDAFNGAMLVGTVSATGTVPSANFDFAEGTISFSGAIFNKVVLSVTGAPSLSIDNLTANVGPITTCPAPIAATYGTLYSSQLTAIGGTGKGYVWSLAAAGSIAPMTLSPTGLISGNLTPASGGGPLSFAVNITDSSGQTEQQPCTITVLPPVITFACSANTASVGVAYSFQLIPTGGSGAGIWTPGGSLGDGLNLTIGGLVSGIPVSAATLTFMLHVTDNISGGNATQQCTINVTAASPPSITSISPNPVPALVGNQTVFINGSGFQSGAGLTVQVSRGGVQTNLTGAQVNFLSSEQLSILINVGVTAANWTMQVINPDTQSSDVFLFSVTPSTTTVFAVPQFVFGGAWYTALYFANTTNAAVQVQVNFYGDDGTALSVPLLGIGSVTSQTISLNPQSTVILEAPAGGTAGEGWAEVTVPSGVVGYAVFRQTVPGRADQEAVVPLTPESGQTADLTYDDILFTTSVAFLNPSAQTVTVTIDTFDVTGVPNGTTQLILAPRAKVATVLKDLPGLSGIFGNRGRVVFSVTSGAISVLGLRFGGSAFTSIPVVHRVANPVTQTTSFALPQFVFGNPWYTALYFSNTTNSTVNVPVSFTSDDGSALSVQLNGIGTVTGQTVTLGPGATAILEALLTDNPGEGWAEATLPLGVIGYAVFRQTIPGRFDQEAVVTVAPESDQTADLIYDDIAFTTSVAFLNPSDQQTTVTITVYSANGTQIGTSQVMLAPHAKDATILKSLPGLSGMAGNRGWATFSVPNGDVSVIGLRFGGSAFTSIPVTFR
jgi:hypothetical protein